MGVVFSNWKHILWEVYYISPIAFCANLRFDVILNTSFIIYFIVFLVRYHYQLTASL